MSRGEKDSLLVVEVDDGIAVYFVHAKQVVKRGLLVFEVAHIRTVKRYFRSTSEKGKISFFDRNCFFKHGYKLMSVF
jgi:hypothetical protein